MAEDSIATAMVADFAAEEVAAYQTVAGKAVFLIAKEKTEDHTAKVL